MKKAKHKRMMDGGMAAMGRKVAPVTSQTNRMGPTAVADRFKPNYKIEYTASGVPILPTLQTPPGPRGAQRAAGRVQNAPVVRPGVKTGPSMPVSVADRRPPVPKLPERSLREQMSGIGKVTPTVPTQTLPSRGSGQYENDGPPMTAKQMADILAAGGVQGSPIPSVYQQTLDSNGNVVTMKHGGKVKSKAMRGGGLARKGVGMALRGGGLARKGVGMALAKGGLAKRAGGIAKRGVGRGKMC